MSIIYHITTRSAWDEALEKRSYAPPSLKEEGFIHCCEQHQVAGVLERYYKGKKHLLKLEIDTDLLNSEFIFEWSPSTADTFPHIYGAINVDAVKSVEAL
ncbi:MAG: DUF952 domain-containing protein [Chitinophagaceae bacterium]